MNIKELINLISTLRKKCPWDKKQTLSSLKNNIVEESYELVEAIEEDNCASIKEEIGDLLFLGLFFAKVLEEEKGISLHELISSTITKYKRKHPHVFKNKKLSNKEEVVSYWHMTKEDIFAGVTQKLPALIAARVIQERASKVGFDWKSSHGPLKKVHEELNELENSHDNQSVFEELGDLLFACVNLARHLSIEPEDALRSANKKFMERFLQIKNELSKQGKHLSEVDLKTMDAIWDEIKKHDSE